MRIEGLMLRSTMVCSWFHDELSKNPYGIIYGGHLAIELLVDGEAPEFCNDVCMTFHTVGPNASYCTTEEKPLGFDSTYYANCTGVGKPLFVLDATTEMAEAAESPGLCAHYCSLIEGCNAFDHDARPPEERPGFAWTDEPTCFLYGAVGSCTNDDPLDGLAWGISPRARAGADARVEVVRAGDNMHMTLPPTAPAAGAARRCSVAGRATATRPCSTRRIGVWRS